MGGRRELFPEKRVILLIGNAGQRLNSSDKNRLLLWGTRKNYFRRRGGGPARWVSEKGDLFGKQVLHARTRGEREVRHLSKKIESYLDPIQGVRWRGGEKNRLKSP